MVRNPVSQQPAAIERSARQILVDARDLVEPAYRTAIDALPARIRRMAGYHIGWWDADGRPTGGSGKLIRPALAVTCGHAAGDGLGATAVVEAAVAVELIHDFSLLHDDVMDVAPTRRHRPATWAVFGVSQAILVGDALLTAAISQLADSAALVHVLVVAMQELCDGQSADISFEERADVGLAECLAMAEAKTGALMGAACQMGALAAGAGDEVADQYRCFGRELGVAFQLVDDLLGIWGDPRTTGKPTGSDLGARKKSLPVVAAMASDTPAGTLLVRLYDRVDDADESTGPRTADLVEAAGGRAWARAETARRVDASMAALGRARPAPAAAVDLRSLAALIARRDQ
jgi:geranylgeranyl diphosphate synthase type I